MPAPANDNFANAITITPSVTPLTIGPTDISGATTEVGEPFPFPPFSNLQTVWYWFHLAADSDITVDVDSSSFAPDNNLDFGFYTGTVLTALTKQWALSMFVGGGPITFSLAAGDYYMQIGTEDTDTTASLVVSMSFLRTPVVRLHDPPVSKLLVTDLSSATLTCLERRSTARKFLFTLNASAYLSCQVPTDDPEINLPAPDPDSPALVSNNTRLIYWLRRETNADPLIAPYVCRGAFLVFNVEDQGTDAPVSTVTAYDPWQYLMKRPVYDQDTLQIPGVDGKRYEATAHASDIALALLNLTAGIDGETFIDTSDGSLLPDTGAIGAPIVFEQTLSVGEAWQRLCATGTIDIHLDPIYDPIGRPGKLCALRFVKQSPALAAGTVRYDAQLGWDMGTKSLSAVSRMIDGTQLANAVRYLTGQGIPSTVLQDASSIAAVGRYWLQQLFGDANDPTALDLVALLAYADLQIRKDGQRTISFDIAPERSQLLALRDYALGDYVPAWASRNLREPISVDYIAEDVDPDHPGAAGYQRLYAIPVELEDDGTEVTRGVLTSKDSVSGG